MRSTLHSSNEFSSKSTQKFARKWAQQPPLFHIIVTSTEGQSHSNWYQTIHFCGIHHHTKLKRNWSVNVQMQANINCFLMNHLSWILSLEYWLTRYNEVHQTNSFNSMPNSIQSHGQLWEITGTDVFPKALYTDKWNFEQLTSCVLLSRTYSLIISQWKMWNKWHHGITHFVL